MKQLTSAELMAVDGGAYHYEPTFTIRSKQRDGYHHKHKRHHHYHETITDVVYVEQAYL